MKRYFIKVGNCFVEFLGLYHEPKMRPDHEKASPYLTVEDTEKEAAGRGLKNYKIVCKKF